MYISTDINFTLFYHITEEGDVKATLAALHFILASAAKYNLDGDSLSNELQQLGLPKGTTVCSKA